MAGPAPRGLDVIRSVDDAGVSAAIARGPLADAELQPFCQLGPAPAPAWRRWAYRLWPLVVLLVVLLFFAVAGLAD